LKLSCLGILQFSTVTETVYRKETYHNVESDTKILTEYIFCL